MIGKTEVIPAITADMGLTFNPYNPIQVTAFIAEQFADVVDGFDITTVKRVIREFEFSIVVFPARYYLFLLALDSIVELFEEFVSVVEPRAAGDVGPAGFQFFFYEFGFPLVVPELVCRVYRVLMDCGRR